MLITPFTTIALENKVSNNLPKQPNDVEGLVAQIRVVIDEILEKFRHNSKVVNQCDIILKLLVLIIKLLLLPFRLVFCIFFIIFSSALIMVLVKLWDKFPELENEIWMMVFFLDIIWAFTCAPSSFPFKSSILSLKTKYIISEPNYITKSFYSCPCVQE